MERPRRKRNFLPKGERHAKDTLKLGGYGIPDAGLLDGMLERKEKCKPQSLYFGEFPGYINKFFSICAVIEPPCTKRYTR